MKRSSKVVLGASAVLFVLLAAGFALWPVFTEKVGDIRPALLPPKKAVTRSDQVALSLPEGFKAGLFAQALGGTRDLEFGPRGTMVVSVPSQGKVLALPDRDNDGAADATIELASGLDRPHGLGFHRGKLYIAEETKVSRYSWNEKELTAALESKIIDLPAGGRHFTRTLAFDEQDRMYISIGSSCDVCREEHPWLAAVVRVNIDGSSAQVFAKGLRNAVFIKQHPQTGELWGTEMGRDFLGDNRPPDEINIIKEGGDYGWPRCYGNRVPDTSFAAGSDCSGTIPPVFEIQAHSAPLGLVFIDSKQFPDDWQGDLLVAYHGSWNRSEPAGYKIARLKVEQQSQVHGEEDFITGFLDNSRSLGRPVDLAFDREGSLYFSDDKAGAVYKIVR